MKILLAEDEEMLRRIIAKTLRANNMTVDSCANGQEALEHIHTSSYDALVIDVMMPKLDGFELVKTIRAEGNIVPVLFLTAKDSLEDRITGLNIGADDYLVKPFEFEELLARLHAIIRRNRQQASNDLIIRHIAINPQSRIVKIKGEEVSLTAKEFDLLYFLASNVDIVLSRQQILDHVWEYDYESYSNLIDVYIKALRKKVDVDPEYKLIHTVRGVGYVFRIPEQ